MRDDSDGSGGRWFCVGATQVYWITISKIDILVELVSAELSWQSAGYISRNAGGGFPIGKPDPSVMAGDQTSQYEGSEL